MSAVGLLCLASASCDRRPKGVLSDSQMVDVMTDLKLAEGYTSTYGGSPSDSVGQRLAESVLADHGVTRAEFDSTLSWYGRNFDEYFKLYDKVNKRLAKRQKDFLSEPVASDANEGSQIWPYSKQVLVSALGTADGLSFSLAGADIKPGEQVRWQMRLSEETSGKVMLGAEYTNGTMQYISRSAMGNKRIELVLPTDTALSVKRIFGNLHLLKNDMPLFIDSISLMHLPLSADDRTTLTRGTRYTRPERYDAVKAKAKARADSVRNAAVRDSLATAPLSQSAGRPGSSPQSSSATSVSTTSEPMVMPGRHTDRGLRRR